MNRRLRTIAARSATARIESKRVDPARPVRRPEVFQRHPWGGRFRVDPIPDDVRRFLDENIESIEQLEILRVLAETPALAKSADDLATEVQATPAAVAVHLVALNGRGLLAVSEQDGRPFGRHGPHTPDHAEKLGRMLQHYRERPVSMIKLVYARPVKRLKAFTDAFKLKKDE
jgi:DNA-binding transcriptional ArsR family regulator